MKTNTAVTTRRLAWRPRSGAWRSGSGAWRSGSGAWRSGSGAWRSRLGAIGLLVCGLVAVLVGLLPAAAARAQTDGQLAALDAFIERNTELLEWARTLVNETDSNVARNVLREATRLHERSLQEVDTGHPYLSFAVAKRARAAIWHAVRLARESLSIQEQLRIRAERFRDLHAHLIDRAHELGDEQALDLLRRAERQAIRAREQYLQGNLQMAMQILEHAEDLMQRAARVLADVGGPETLDRELDRTRSLLDRVRERTHRDADPAVAKLLAEAEEALDRALDHRDRGQPGRALQMAGLARRLAGQAAAQAGGDVATEVVQRQIDRFDQRAALLGDQVRDTGSAGVVETYQRALDHRTRAVASLAEGQTEPALRQIKAAQDLLNQVDDLLHP